jgi:hypothetical protein
MTGTARGNRQPMEERHKHRLSLSLAVVTSALVLIATSQHYRYDLKEDYHNFSRRNVLSTTTTTTTTTTTMRVTGRSLLSQRFYPPLEEEEDQYNIEPEEGITSGTVTAVSISENQATNKTGDNNDDDDDETLLLKMVERLSPKTFTTRPFDPTTDVIVDRYSNRKPATSSNTTTISSTNRTILSQHQFLHLHHMKTAGTSMDEVIQCGIARMKAMQGGVDRTVPYYNIHECSESSYRDCLQGTSANGQTCQTNVRNSAILSYCAPLHDLDIYGWTSKKDGSAVTTTTTTTTTTTHQPEASPPPPKKVVVRDNDFHALTVLRDPVARVWSMYRFKTKSCYQCVPLLDVYAAIDAGTSKITSMCASQLQNHMTKNLLSTVRSSITKEGNTNAQDSDEEKEKVQEAIYNMQHFFTLIGLTEQLDTTMELLHYTFPWLNETIAGSAKRCALPHANSSPRNNPCPSAAASEPDEATRQAIEAHNRLDVQVYQAAVQHFELQTKALRYIQNQKRQ